MILSRSTARRDRFVGLARGWIAALILTAQGGFSAPATVSGDHLIEVWDVQNGLPNSSVTAIAQTREGYLWVGTHNGLARFDGIRFVSFEPRNTPELKHARILGLFVDDWGTLWINTYDGSLTSWRNGTFRAGWPGEPDAQMVASFSRSNEVLFATQSGDLLSRTGSPDTAGQWQWIRPAGRTIGQAYEADANGVLWYRTRDGSVGQIHGTNASLLPAQVHAGQTVQCLSADRAGRIWIGTRTGIAVWDGKHFKNQTPTDGEPQLDTSFLFWTRDHSCWAIANGRVRKFVDRRWVAEAEGWGVLFHEVSLSWSAHEDRLGGAWFRHYGQGIFHARPDGTTHRISAASGLPGDRVSSWFEDREGNIWLGVDRGGLVRLREKRFQVINPASGLSGMGASSVCQDEQGTIWIGTFGGGLNRVEDGQLVPAALAEGSLGKFFFSTFPGRDGRLWVSAGREDLFVLEQGRIGPPPVNVHGVKVILQDRRGRVWLGKKDGLECLQDGTSRRFGPEDGFEVTDVHAIAEDQAGTIWVGGGNGALYQFGDGQVMAHRAEEQRISEAIWSLLADEDGTLWVGTFRGGLLRFKDGRFTRYTVGSGLPHDVIAQLLDDGVGNLWIGSHKGIFQIPKAALHAVARGKPGSLPCVAYGTCDGLPSLECSGGYQPAAWRTRDGRLWFTTFKGVVSIRPDNFPENPLPPPVVIEDVMVGGRTVLLSETGNPAMLHRKGIAPGAGQLRIPPGKSQVEFHYTAPSFVAPDQVAFRYQLEGLDTEWIEAGQRRSAQYSHLKHGHYRFHVTARKNNSDWSEDGATLELTVLPRFWETWWFLSLVGLALSGGLVGTVRLVTTRKLRRELEQLERQRAVERDRVRIAQDIHDDLGAGLTRIMLQSELARRDPPQEAKAHLGQIAETARGLTRTMDEIVWAVDPQHDTLDGLMDYATAYAEEFLRVAGIRCRMDLPATTPPLPVDAEARYHLFLALKEALNNVVKHAQASEVWLRLRVEQDGFTLVLEDNGRGLPGSIGEQAGPRTSSGRGLLNLENRLRAVGGRCLISSAPGGGTRVELTVRAQPKGSALMAMGGNGSNTAG